MMFLNPEQTRSCQRERTSKFPVSARHQRTTRTVQPYSVNEHHHGSNNDNIKDHIDDSDTDYYYHDFNKATVSYSTTVTTTLIGIAEGDDRDDDYSDDDGEDDDVDDDNN